MSTRSTVLAAMTLALFASAPSTGQTYYSYGVHSTSQTLGYTGTYTDDSKAQPGGTYAATVSDPAGATLSAPGYATLYADVAASSETRQAELNAQASGHAHVVSGTNISGAAPYGYAYARFYDRLTVKSNDLSNGTPVTIVFGNEVEIRRWERSGGYDSYIDMTLQIAAGTARSRWSSHSMYGETAAVAPQLVINTTVGSYLSVNAQLRIMAKVFYERTAQSDVQADAKARLVVREIPAGVTLEADSGTVYPFVPAP